MKLHSLLKVLGFDFCIFFSFLPNSRAAIDSIIVASVQTDTVTLKSTSFHLGIGSQKFIHVGLGQQIGPILLQGSLGVVPVFYNGTSLSGGLYWLPQKPWNEWGMNVGVEFSYIELKHFYTDGADRISKAVSVNAAFMLLESRNIGLMVKDGFGFVVDNNRPYSGIRSILFFNLDFALCFSI